MKNQRFVYGSVVEKNGILLFSDVEGKLYNLPELNEKGSPLYKRARAAANAPGKWAFKVRVVGTLKSGSLGFTRVGVEMLAGAEPVTNFDKPNGGLESYLYNSNPTTEPMVTNVPEDVLNFIIIPIFYIYQFFLKTFNIHFNIIINFINFFSNRYCK